MSPENGMSGHLTLDLIFKILAKIKWAWKKNIFFHLQLNSDVIYHKSNKYGKTKVIYVDTAYVGKLLVTKKKESSEYEDITATYKYPEGKIHSVLVYWIKKQCDIRSGMLTWLKTLGIRGGLQGFFLRKVNPSSVGN